MPSKSCAGTRSMPPRRRCAGLCQPRVSRLCAPRHRHPQICDGRVQVALQWSRRARKSYLGPGAHPKIAQRRVLHQGILFAGFSLESMSLSATSSVAGRASPCSCKEHLKQLIAEASAVGSVRLFSIRHEFPSEWSKLTNTTASTSKRQELCLNLLPGSYTRLMGRGADPVRASAGRRVCSRSSRRA